MLQLKDHYEGLLSGPIDKDPMIALIVRQSTKIKEVPIGRKLIKAMLYTGLIHQGDNSTHLMKKKINELITDEAIRDYVFYVLILSLSRIIIKVGNWTYNILRDLGQLSFNLPTRRISSPEEEFNRYVDEKAMDLAEIIWRENGGKESVRSFQPQAKRELIGMFVIE